MRFTLAATAALAALTLVAGYTPAASAAGTVTLTGAEEVDAGDPDGTGEFKFNIRRSHSEFCWELSWQDIGTPTAAHVHEAPEGVAGPPVVDLSDMDGPVMDGCSAIDEDVARAIKDDEENYYVNVHNAEFPGGAIRAQLD